MLDDNNNFAEEGLLPAWFPVSAAWYGRAGRRGCCATLVVYCPVVNTVGTNTPRALSGSDNSGVLLVQHEGGRAATPLLCCPILSAVNSRSVGVGGDVRADSVGEAVYRVATHYVAVGVAGSLEHFVRPELAAVTSELGTHEHNLTNNVHFGTTLPF